MRQGRDPREEFADFHRTSYAELVAQLVALLGDAPAAEDATRRALGAARRSWGSLRRQPDPLPAVRWAAAQVGAEERAEDAGVGRLPSGTDPEDAVVVGALHELPAAQRRFLVLHYMAGMGVDDLARLDGSEPDEVEALLDTGYDALVEVLEWSEDAGDDPDARYDWTAHALADTATRLARQVTVPDPPAGPPRDNAPAARRSRAAMTRA